MEEPVFELDIALLKPGDTLTFTTESGNTYTFTLWDQHDGTALAICAHPRRIPAGAHRVVVLGTATLIAVGHAHQWKYIIRAPGNMVFRLIDPPHTQVTMTATRELWITLTENAASYQLYPRRDPRFVRR